MRLDRCPGSTFPTRIGLALALAFGALPPALALPTGEQVVSGQVAVGRPTAQNMVVQQGTGSAIVNWNSFSIGAAEGVQFLQPGASSVILNRVVQSNPSAIAGRLTANGRVFLVNPSGVLFARGASVDVGALVASTLDIRDADFLAGRYSFAGAGSGAVVNQGTLQAVERGTIALLGGQVSNEGTVTARLGTVALAAGNKVTLDFAGDGLTAIRVDEAAVGAQVRNSGMIVADGGQAVLTARAAEALAETVINQQGVVRARSLVERNGRIVLDGGDTGVTLVTGQLDASGRDPGLVGGNVAVLGHHVGLAGAAALDASGDAGGGTVLVGGDTQGRNPLVRNAVATYLGTDTVIDASALDSGPGGRVIVWSDEATRAYGRIIARGGARVGDGGFVETSGRQLDTFGIRVDAGAPAGAPGKWLLDPIDVLITDATQNVATVGVAPEVTFTPIGPPAQTAPSLLDAATLSNALNTNTSVTVATSGDTYADVDGAPIAEAGNIIVAANIAKDSATDATLTLNAHNDVVVLSGVAITATGSGRLNVNFNSNSDNAGGGGIVMSPQSLIQTNGGTVAFYGQSNAATGRAAGIALDGASIGTCNSVGAACGNVVMRSNDVRSVGEGGPSASIVIANGSTVSAGSGTVSLDGQATGQSGSGVLIDGSDILTTSGAITIAGTGVSNTIAPLAGVWVLGGNVRSATGNIRIEGLALAGDTSNPPIGVVLGDANNSELATTVSSAAGDVVTVGQAASLFSPNPSTAFGLQLNPGASVGVAGGTGNIVLAARNGGTADSIELAGLVQTAGVLNLRPGVVGSVADSASGDAIDIGGGAASFNLSATDLAALQPGFSAIVIGSNSHAGAITVAAPVSFSDNVSLQNTGAGSAGIALNAALSAPGRTITLASAGTVTQSAPITAQNLLVSGPGAGDFVLTEPSNAVSVFASDPPASVQFVNGGALVIGPVTGTGFDSATNAPQTIVASDSAAIGNFFVRTLAGDITLDQDVTTSGAGSRIDLVSAGIFNNAGSGTLTPGAGGSWRVWADTSVGETRGGLNPGNPQPNFYGCSYPGTCASEISIPATGNHFIYRQRPSATVTADSLSRFFGLPNPPLTFSVTGLLNGDSASDAAAGTLATPAVATSPAGDYSITGEFISPVGYLLDFVPGTLTVLPQRPSQPVYYTVIEYGQTQLYGRNLGVSNMCLATGPLLVSAEVDNPDQLDREWSRVRQLPNLTNCVEVAERHGCQDF
jgi:filamentous hemagglutinin family protein